MTDLTDQIKEVMYRELKSAQRDLGMARFKLGTLLEVFRNNDKLWEGHAGTFAGFLEEERIQYNGAQQFMKVARKFVLELKLSDRELSDLACVNFRILELAAKVITPENKEEVIANLTALGERDARTTLEEMLEGDGEGKERKPPIVPKPVQTLMRRYRELPDDHRLAFLGIVAPRGNNAARQPQR